MTTVTARSRAADSGGILLPWTIPSAWGAGLILAGMGAAAFVAAIEEPAVARVVGVTMVALGLLALAWGAASLHRGRIVAPRAAIAASVAALAGLGALLVATSGRASVIGAAVATVLLTVTALLVVASRRHGAAPAASVRMLPLLLAAVLIAVVVTPALGAVQDAALVRDDGTLVVVDPHQGH